MDRHPIDSDDDELRRAIQMSLQSEKVVQPSIIVDLTGDDEEIWPGFDDLEDMEVWKAIAVSMGESTVLSEISLTVKIEPSYEVCQRYKINSQSETTQVHGIPTSSSTAPIELSETASEEGDETASEEEEELPRAKVEQTKATTSNGSAGLQGLNRAEMERQRLERLKRAGLGPTSIEPPTKKLKIEHVITETNTKSIPQHMAGGMEYPNGTIKWTRASGYPVESHHVTIEQVLQKDTLKAAVLSAYQVIFMATWS